MEKIGGNITAVLQIKKQTKNAFGSNVITYDDVATLEGWLDYSGGDGSYKTNYKGPVEETTNIFICDYADLGEAKKKPTLYRLLIDGAAYDVLKIDDPMELHYQLEIYLKYSEVVQ